MSNKPSYDPVDPNKPVDSNIARIVSTNMGVMPLVIPETWNFYEGLVVPVAQTSPKSCWAACATMLWQWLHRTTVPRISIDQVMDIAGPEWKEKYRANLGLTPSEKRRLASALKFKVTEPRYPRAGPPPYDKTYSKQKWLEMLVKYGPLWVTTTYKRATNHARIVVGVNNPPGSNEYIVSIIDPCAAGDSGVDTGDRCTCEAGTLKHEWLDFISSYENRANVSASPDWDGRIGDARMILHGPARPFLLEQREG